MSTTDILVLIFKLLAPVMGELFSYLTGQSDQKPAILLTLPAELQSEAALARLKVKAAKGHVTP
ncbi:MAG: hypothetical protein KGL39_18060 [Patescibacteria group bacterium]|nr:hypothetical protein [Patescibacteria group bacterium]